MFTHMHKVRPNFAQGISYFSFGNNNTANKKTYVCTLLAYALFQVSYLFVKLLKSWCKLLVATRWQKVVFVGVASMYIHILGQSHMDTLIL